MSDLIDRQAAIDAVKRHTFRLTFAEEQNCEGHVAWSAEAVYSEVMEGVLLDLPSAQPEIIRCKECKYGVQDEDKQWYCRGLGCQVGEADGSGFCADAERRTKDEDTL